MRGMSWGDGRPTRLSCGRHCMYTRRWCKRDRRWRFGRRRIRILWGGISGFATPAQGLGGSNLGQLVTSSLLLAATREAAARRMSVVLGRRVLGGRY